MSNDHFYTTSLRELNDAITRVGYVNHRTVCYVMTDPAAGPIHFIDTGAKVGQTISIVRTLMKGSEPPTT
jgi:hypothetical protein